MLLLKKVLRPVYYFFSRYVANIIIANIPIWIIRKSYYKLLGMKIGKGSVIHMSVYILEPKKISIGEFTHINQGCILDGRGCLRIGNSVSISHRVALMTGSHDLNSKTFEGRFKPIEIKDFTWIGVNSIILQDTTIRKGVVVAAGSVVTKSIDDFCIVAGIPAKVIGVRNKDLDYKCIPNAPFL